MRHSLKPSFKVSNFTWSLSIADRSSWPYGLFSKMDKTLLAFSTAAVFSWLFIDLQNDFLRTMELSSSMNRLSDFRRPSTRPNTDIQCLSMHLKISLKVQNGRDSLGLIVMMVLQSVNAFSISLSRTWKQRTCIKICVKLRSYNLFLDSTAFKSL